jgi:hypothetical protein
LGLYASNKEKPLTSPEPLSHPSKDYGSLPQFDAEMASQEPSAPPVTPAVLRYASRLILIMICSFLAGHVPCFELVSCLSLTVSPPVSGHLFARIIHCLPAVLCLAVNSASRPRPHSSMPFDCPNCPRSVEASGSVDCGGVSDLLWLLCLHLRNGDDVPGGL